MVDAGSLEDAAVPGIAEHHLMPFPTRRPEPGQIIFDSDVGDFRRLQHRRHQSADADTAA